MVVDAAKLRSMPEQEIKWFIQLAETGLKGSWKGHKLEAQVKKALKDLKGEIKRRKAS